MNGMFGSLITPAMGATVAHIFVEDLRESNEDRHRPEWLACYKEFFPGIPEKNIILHLQDGPHQREGIDVSLTLTNAKQISIDEKERKEAYPDILLEVWSDEERLIPGWVQKPLRCDFIGYMVIPDRQCHLLPVLQLQAAWKKYGKRWYDQFQFRRSPNKNGCRSWTTANVPVPIDTLYRAMSSMLHCSF